MSNSSSYCLLNRMYYKVIQTVASEALLILLIFPVNGMALFLQVAVCHSPYGPEEPSTPSFTTCHCPLSVILKIRITVSHTGLQ